MNNKSLDRLYKNMNTFVHDHNIDQRDNNTITFHFSQFDVDYG